MPGLVALIKRAVTIERQGSASDPVPILDGVDRIRAFEVSEESFRIPAVRVNQVPIRQYIYGELLSHVLGFMGPIAALADDYREAGYNDPNEKVGLNGLSIPTRISCAARRVCALSSATFWVPTCASWGLCASASAGLEPQPEH